MESSLREIISSGLELVFYILVIASTLHTLMLAYHWFTYGSDRRISTSACVTYVTGHIFFLSILWITIHII